MEINTLCILKKLSTNPNELRTNTVDGYFLHAPKVGEQFTMFADPLENPTANFRIVQTSLIREIEWIEVGAQRNSACLFKTLNSEYRLDILAH